MENKDRIEISLPLDKYEEILSKALDKYTESVGSPEETTERLRVLCFLLKKNASYWKERYFREVQNREYYFQRYMMNALKGIGAQSLINEPINKRDKKGWWEIWKK